MGQDWCDGGEGGWPRQYLVRMDGSGRITLRNRRFLRKCSSFADSPYPSLVVQETTPVQSKTKKPPGPNQVTTESIPADEIIPELGVTEEGRGQRDIYKVYICTLYVYIYLIYG